MIKLEQMSLEAFFEREADNSESYLKEHFKLQTTLKNMGHPCNNMFGIYRIGEIGLEQTMAIYKGISRYV